MSGLHLAILSTVRRLLLWFGSMWIKCILFNGTLRSETSVGDISDASSIFYIQPAQKPTNQHHVVFSACLLRQTRLYTLWAGQPCSHRLLYSLGFSAHRVSLPIGHQKERRHKPRFRTGSYGHISWCHTSPAAATESFFYVFRTSSNSLNAARPTNGSSDGSEPTTSPRNCTNGSDWETEGFCNMSVRR